MNSRRRRTAVRSPRPRASRAWKMAGVRPGQCGMECDRAAFVMVNEAELEEDGLMEAEDVVQLCQPICIEMVNVASICDVYEHF
jgi:hypothetical protein